MERATWSAQASVDSRQRTRFFTPSEAERTEALSCPLSPTLTTTLSYLRQPHKHDTPKPWSGRLELGVRGGDALHDGSCSSTESFALRWVYKWDSCSQKAPRGRLALSCHLTCSMDVTVSTESSCNRSRACSGLRLYRGSDQTGEEDGGQ